MALDTYSSLQTAIANWLHRSDLTSIIPDLITMAESRLNRQLRLRMMEIDASLTMTPSSRYVSLPSDFNSPVALWLETYTPRQKLTPSLPENMPVVTTNGQPEYWAVDGANLAFDKPASQNYSLTFRYIKRLTLSNSNPTNALLTEYPDAYLFGALLEAAPYIKDDARIAVWQDRFDRAMKEISTNENETRAIPPLTTELGNMRQTARFNINRGW